jgi:GAF domain-containing protein
LQDGSGQNKQMTQAFADIASALLQNQADLDGLVDGLQATTCRLLRCEMAEFCSVDHSEQVIRSFKPSEYEEFQIPLADVTIPGTAIEHLGSKFFLGYVIKTGTLLNSYDPANDVRFGTVEELKEKYDGTRNILCVPLRDVQGVITGVVQVINKLPDSASFDRDDEALLDSFAHLIASVIDRSKVMMDVKDQLSRMSAVSNYFSTVLTSLPYIVFAVDRELRLVRNFYRLSKA